MWKFILSALVVMTWVTTAKADTDFYAGVFVGETSGEMYSVQDYPIILRAYDKPSISWASGMRFNENVQGAFVGWNGIHLGDAVRIGPELTYTSFGINGPVIDLDYATDLKLLMHIDVGERSSIHFGGGYSRASTGEIDTDLNGWVAQVGYKHHLTNALAVQFDVTHHEWQGRTPLAVHFGPARHEMEATTFSVGLSVNF